MNTIRISVKSDKEMQQLLQLIASLDIDIHVEQNEADNNSVNNQFDVLKKILDDASSPQLFSEINDPVKWQRNLRDEWR